MAKRLTRDTVAEEARSVLSKDEVARLMPRRRHPILRDALLRNAPQDEVGRELGRGRKSPRYSFRLKKSGVGGGPQM
jgi:hypothetical protein